MERFEDQVARRLGGSVLRQWLAGELSRDELLSYVEAPPADLKEHAARYAMARADYKVACLERGVPFNPILDICCDNGWHLPDPGAKLLIHSGPQKYEIRRLA